MRGDFRFHNRDRIQFFIILHDLCDIKNHERVNLSTTHLNLSNCEDALNELGYDCTHSEIDAWEFWRVFTCEGLPSIEVSGDSYSASLIIRFYDIMDAPDTIDIEAFINNVQQKWGMYFPQW